MTKKDLVEAIKYNGGTVRSISELITIDRNGEELRKWNTETDKGGSVYRFGNPIIYAYEEVDDSDKTEMVCEEYSCWSL